MCLKLAYIYQFLAVDLASLKRLYAELHKVELRRGVACAESRARACVHVRIEE